MDSYFIGKMQITDFEYYSQCSLSYQNIMNQLQKISFNLLKQLTQLEHYIKVEIIQELVIVLILIKMFWNLGVLTSIIAQAVIEIKVQSKVIYQCQIKFVNMNHYFSQFCFKY
ncbi:unnamed protein product [Paramecium sonneborni]|uniref:Transmembrane protein n=1 Tax=Paramecium sonneborni TaxID=65129 RepID=A0A8S1RPV4_9CILI|nr:unnamed protein product [Paramecium sonneborni]